MVIFSHMLSLSLSHKPKAQERTFFLFQFVRESIVQMPEEDFNVWFQTRVAHLSAQSSTI